MSSADSINGIVDAILAIITANFATLGITAVTETDEEPRYIEPSQAYVIPFVEGRDTIRTFAGGNEHTYPVNIVGFYKYDTIQAGLRPTRTYGLDALDLFSGSSGSLYSVTLSGPVGAEVGDASLEVGYWRNGDYIMHYWTLQLQIRQIA